MSCETPRRSTRLHPTELFPGLEAKNRQKRNLNSQQKNLATSKMASDDDTIETLRAEVARLRELNDVQSAQLIQLHRVANNNGDNDSQIVRELINGLRTINIDIKVPKFDESENPNQFIERLQRFYTVKSIPNDGKLSVLEGSFEGRARAWFDTQKNTFINYEDFQTKFLAEFYSIPVRVKIKSSWLAKRFDGNKGNLQTYFLNQIRDAQYFIPRLEAYELHYTVIQQMPTRIRDALATVDFSNFDKISQALSQLDLTFQEKTNNRKQTVDSGGHAENPTENRGNQYRNQRSLGQGPRGDSSQSNQSGDRQTRVVNSHIQSYRPQEDDTRVTNLLQPRAYPRIPLPDTTRPPPPLLGQTSELTHSYSGNLNSYEMRSLGASNQNLYDDFHKLSDECVQNSGDDDFKANSSKIALCPRLLVCLFSIPVQGLVDTGSQITAMSDSFYQYLKKFYKLVELPVTNVILFSAIGKKPTNIKKQISCELSIDDKVYPTSFLIVPNLSNPIILGNDWFLSNEVIIDYKQMNIVVQGDGLNEAFVSFGVQSQGHLKISKEKDDLVYLQLTSSVMTISNCSHDDNKRDSDEIYDLGESFLFKPGKNELNLDLQNRISIKSNSLDVNNESALSHDDLLFADYDEDFECSSDGCWVNEIDTVNNVYGELTYEDRIREIASKLEFLDEEEKDYFVQEMSQFKKLFTPKTTSADTFKYKFKVKPHKAIIRKTYPVAIKYRDRVGEKLDEMERLNIIERSDSDYCNPLRIAVKSDGTIRVCLDARFINEIIEADQESPPLIAELMQKFFGIKFMTIVDFASGYWQIPLDESCRKYTAFLFNSKLYQFCRVPFGLKTAGSAFLRAINFAIGNQFDKVLTTYIDDFLVATIRTVYEHIRALCLILLKLQEKNFTLNLEKCHFCQKQVNFLGYELTTTGIRPLTDKLSAIANFEKPKNRKDLQQFVGICTYYRQFTVRHADLINPFRDLLREKNVWEWNSQHDEAFEIMKKAFIESVELSHYIPNVPYRLQTDASDMGISGVLYQIDSNNDHRIVSLVSRCLNGAEMNYTTTEKELLAIVYSIMKLRIYLLGTRFEIITDHKALTFLHTTVYLNTRMIRWIITLQQYDFAISHCAGKDNIVADFFSRNPRGKFETNQPRTLSIDVLEIEINSIIVESEISSIDLGDDIRGSLENLAALQKKEPNNQKIFEKLIAGEHVPYYVLEQGILFHRNEWLHLWQVVIPSELTSSLIECVHSKLGHPGVYKTLMYIKRCYYWKGMAQEIKKFVLSCDLCQRVKSVNVQMECSYQMVYSSRPGDLV